MPKQFKCPECGSEDFRAYFAGSVDVKIYTEQREDKLLIHDRITERVHADQLELDDDSYHCNGCSAEYNMTTLERDDI